MANTAPYKQRNRRDRKASLETDFSKGMMATQGVVDEGYLKTMVNFSFEKENHSIVPRPAFNITSVSFLDGVESEDFFSEKVSIKASKECVENGVTYNQTVLGKLDDDSDNLGVLWLNTSLKDTDPTKIVFSDSYTDYLTYAKSTATPAEHKSYFYTAADSSVHNIPMEADDRRRIEFPVGTFAFGNSYYFFGEEEVPSNDPLVEPTIRAGLFKTEFDEETSSYKFAAVTPKEPTVSEAVTYGYNMLRKNLAYSFSNIFQANKMEFQGILPYESDEEHSHSNLLMTPRKNQPIDLVCYYDNANTGSQYEIIWEWREITASDWTPLGQITYTIGDTALVIDNFKPPAKEIMIRVSAYPYEGSTLSDTVEKAMTVGFDFTVENYGQFTSVEQKEYDLTTAKGMCSWNSRIAVWGVPEDPTILFISDYEDPSYFPYPNNITVFDSPIIYVCEFMDSLAVFTTDKLYQLALASDGNSWQKTLLQSHLHINPWDRHLIQTVRNMLYFKSGNYYYMMVPKAQSLTGELTLAPITTPITSFFDNFSVNVADIFKSTYGYTDEYKLITYYNFLDYEDIHNIYTFKFNETTSVVNFDVIYNTVDRTWKIWIFETPNIIFPYKNDATQTGILAVTSLIAVNDVMESSEHSMRVIQLFKWNKLNAIDYYLASNEPIYYYDSDLFPSVDTEHHRIVVDSVYAQFEGRLAHLKRPYTYIDAPVILLQSPDDYYSGFNKVDINMLIRNMYRNADEYFTFGNYQFLDTGYRNDDLSFKKRYRELQLNINNLDTNNLDFGMEYYIDGSPTKVVCRYDASQAIDELDPNYGVVYVDSVPYMETDLDDIDISNQWSIDQGLTPEISLWKVRVSVAGKGSAPRFKLYSKNAKRFELLGINWIYKTMHMR